MKIIFQYIIKILLIIIVLQFIYIPTTEASFWGDIFKNGDEFISEGKEQGTAVDGKEIKEETNKIYNLLFTAGVVLTVIIGAVLGIEFMFGGIEEQVKVKEMLIPYIVGCLVIYGAFGIWKIMVTLFSNIA